MPSETASPAPQITPSDQVTSLDLPAKVAVTLPMFEYFVREAAGDAAEVISLVPAGEDPTTYSLTAADLDLLSGVEFFYVNGLGLDDHLLEVIESNRDERAFVIPFSPNIRSPEIGGKTAEQAGDEPHLWLDPLLASVYVEIVADEFIIYDGVNRSTYSDSFSAFRERMRDLSRELQETLSAIPEGRRLLVTENDDLTHLARRFGFEVVATADQQAGGVEDIVQSLAQIVRSDDVPAVFGFHGYDDSVMSAVALEADVPLCLLYTDIFDEAVSGYDEMMRANATELVSCLGD
ncbi:MAG: metal ABC transporter substrate-binding protein [Dehalococcoidia bacterium]